MPVEVFFSMADIPEKEINLVECFFVWYNNQSLSHT